MKSVRLAFANPAPARVPLLARASESQRLHDRARGFRDFIAIHSIRGNSDAVAEARGELRSLLEIVERRLAGGNAR